MIQIGDIVKIRYPVVARGASANVTYTVAVIPLRQNLAATWWELTGNDDGKTYIFSMDLGLVIYDP
jgi:hypothetical protein